MEGQQQAKPLGLDYSLGEGADERRQQRWKQIREKPEKPVEVNCLGKNKFKVLGRHVVTRIRLFDEQGGFQDYDGVEYEDLCPVCGTLMLVRAIKGSTWLACCSQPCYDKYREYDRKWSKWMNDTRDTRRIGGL